MKRAVVATYCERDSYGSVYQAMAFKNALSQLGVSSFIPKLAEKINQYKLSLYVPKSPGQCIIVANRILHKKQMEKRFARTLQFIRQQVDIKTYNTYEELKEKAVGDCYIAGSDQIWHPHLCSPLFFLDFAPEGKRISYAASMGTTKIPEQKRELFYHMLKNFDKISVREADNVSVIQSGTEHPVQVHIDPTFLCERTFWEEKEIPYDIKEPYILVYPLYWDLSLNEQLKKLHRESGMKIVAVCNDWMRVYANKTLYDVGPGEFLWLIHHAEAVVTSSFHGVALSTIYNKKLAMVVNPHMPSRLNSLANLLGLKTVKITEVLDMDIAFYTHVNQKIQEEKTRSVAYLKENVE